MDDPFELRADGTVVLRVHVQPGATRTRVLGRHGDALKVAVAAPPDRGRANEAVLLLLAEVLGVPRGAVELLAGAIGRSKRLGVHGLGLDEVRTALGNAEDAARVARRRR